MEEDWFSMVFIATIGFGIIGLGVYTVVTMPVQQYPHWGTSQDRVYFVAGCRESRYSMLDCARMWADLNGGG